MLVYALNLLADYFVFLNMHALIIITINNKTTKDMRKEDKQGRAHFEFAGKLAPQIPHN